MLHALAARLPVRHLEERRLLPVLIEDDLDGFQIGAGRADDHFERGAGADELFRLVDGD